MTHPSQTTGSLGTTFGMQALAVVAATLVAACHPAVTAPLQLAEAPMVGLNVGSFTLGVAPQAPWDDTAITPVETVGASRND